jgi:hypothetical protein
MQTFKLLSVPTDMDSAKISKVVAILDGVTINWVPDLAIVLVVTGHDLVMDPAQSNNVSVG